MQKYYPHLYQNIIDTKDFLFYPMNYNLWNLPFYL
jgi:hypothetical protein